jgi:hypothetical protein
MDVPNNRLLELIPTLTPQEQFAVEAFIRYLKETNAVESISPQAAFEEFVRDHSHLLRRLAS